MNEHSHKLKVDLTEFQMSVQRLSSGIREASTLWRDPKYAELSMEITQVANQSRTVLVAGNKCCEVIDKFFTVSEEEY